MYNQFIFIRISDIMPTFASEKDGGVMNRLSGPWED